MRTLVWLGLGAAAMYLFDPEQGRRRRDQVRDQMTRMRDKMRERAASGNADYPLEPGQAPSETPEGAHHLGR
jgi:hypothetical protein